jgi:hypothetical protein
MSSQNKASAKRIVEELYSSGDMTVVDDIVSDD